MSGLCYGLHLGLGRTLPLSAGLCLDLGLDLSMAFVSVTEVGGPLSQSLVILVLVLVVF